MNKESILITNGFSQCGSHVCITLLKNNYNVIVMDNLIDSNIDMWDYINIESGKCIDFYKTNLTNIKHIEYVFNKHKINKVIHFTSDTDQNNLISIINLLKVMQQHNVKSFIFNTLSNPIYETLLQYICQVDLIFNCVIIKNTNLKNVDYNTILNLKGFNICNL